MCGPLVPGGVLSLPGGCLAIADRLGLPLLHLAWEAELTHLLWRCALCAAAAGAQLSAAELLLTAPPLQLRVETDAATLSDCSDLCLCPPPPAEGATAAPWAPAAVVYASRCRAEVPIGATCANPLPVRRGAHNHATGVHDQFFVYTPAASATHCSVSAAHRGILRSTKRAPA